MWPLNWGLEGMRSHVGFFPFVWLSAYLILEPINAWLGNRTLLDSTSRGDWRPPVALAVGCCRRPV
jgi:hypothetical protein